MFQYLQDIEDIENEQIARLGWKIKMNRHFRYVKDINQKKVHHHWCTYFWRCEHGLGIVYTVLITGLLICGLLDSWLWYI